MFPDNITCPTTFCNYLIVTCEQNKSSFIKYCANTLQQLDNGKFMNFSFRFQSFLYGKNNEQLKIIQIAECFSNNLFKNQNSSNFSIELKNGMILVSPFDNDIKNKLSQLLLHANIKIITYDFTADISNLMDEKISFKFESIIDGNISKITGQKLFELPFSSLTTAYKKSKFYRPNKNSKYDHKNKQNLHTSTEFSYLLQNTEDPINSLLKEKFWESIVNDCAYVAYACANSFSNIGISKVIQFTSEKVKAFCEIQKQFGIFGPLLMKKFFNDDRLLHSNDISSENYAYDVWTATQNVLVNFDQYNKIVPSNRRLTKSGILELQKKAENKILNVDVDLNYKPPSQTISEFKPLTSNDGNNKQSKNMKIKPSSIQSWQKISENIQTEAKNAKKRTGNNRIDNIISIIDYFVKQNSIYLKEMQQNWDVLYPKILNIQQTLQLNDKSFYLIEQSIQNIKNYNKPGQKKISNEKKKLITNNINEILIVVNIFLSFMSDKKIKKESKIIEQKLFNVIFNPTNDDSLITKIFSVYRQHDDFIYTKESIANFKSSTGSGKTRCAPFFFSIKAIEDDMKKPFFIMTQPGFSIIKDKIKDFHNILGDSVILIKDIWEMVDLYCDFINKNKDRKKYQFSKPIVGLFSPQSLLTLIHKLQKRKINIYSITRFCLDEIHERSVESDVLEALLSSNMNEMINKRKNFPLQLLMMSATPDSRILNCFEKVVRFELPSSQLFPVNTIKVQVENKNQVNEEVVKQTFDIVKNMAKKQVRYGHILIFTSGNSRINDIQAEIFENAEEHCSSENCIVFVIKNFDLLFKNSEIDQFYSNLDELIHRETQRINTNLKRNCNIMFLLPIKYMGYVSNEQKEIGKNPIPKHPNVIKIIMATNAIESSITIDGLAAVVDSGLFNHSSYDKSNGLTSLNEEPISIQSQTQRKGRVGRIRPGISVQITLKNQALPVLLPPAIKTSDISLNILFLRKIGYKLEDIKNLPDPLEKEEIDNYISELISFNALDKKNHNLTSYGRVLGDFSFVSPFVASAIIKVAGYKPNEILLKNSEKVDDDEEIEKQFRLLLGIMISLLFGAPDLCVNRFSSKLRFYFDKKSDIITLLRTLLDLAQMKTIDIKANAFYYGMNAQIAVKILGQVQQAAENLFFSSKEMREANQKETRKETGKETASTSKNQSNTSQEKNEKDEEKNVQTNTEKDTQVNKIQDEIKKTQINLVLTPKNQNKEQESVKKETTNSSQTSSNKEIVIQKKSSSNITIDKSKTLKLIITKKSSSTNIMFNEQQKSEKETNNDHNSNDEKNSNNEQQENSKEHIENKEQDIDSNSTLKTHDDDFDSKSAKKEKVFKFSSQNQENKNKYFNRRNIFKYLRQLVDKLIKDNLLYRFIQDLINEIGKNKPEWINCRKAKFANIEYAYDEPSFIYSGDKSLSAGNSSSFVCVRMRPGSIELDSPGSVFILSITHELNSRMNFGSLIHCDLEEEETNPIPHPVSIETTAQLFNDFTEPLIESYLSNKMNHFKKFCRERWNRNDEGNCLLFKSQEMISETNIKYYFSFIPKDKEAFELFKNAAKFIEPLLPYTPSTILIKHPNLKCAIAIRGVGTNVIDSSLHFFNGNDYFPYQMNEQTIKFLIKNIQYLSCVDESISIGITGESFCYPLGDSSFKKQHYSKIWYPQSNSSCASVFSNEPFFFTHMVMLSKIELSQFQNYLLPWDTELSTIDYVEEDLILHAANEIARELITVRKSFNRLLFTIDDSYLRTKGDLEFSLICNRYSSEEEDSGEINNILNNLVKNYIQGDSLIKPVELSAFFYAIPKGESMPEIGYIPKTKCRKVFGYGCLCFDVDDDNAVEEVKKNIIESVEILEEMEENAFTIINQNQELKTRVINLISHSSEIKENIFDCIDPNDDFLDKIIELNDIEKESIKKELNHKINNIISGPTIHSTYGYELPFFCSPIHQTLNTLPFLTGSRENIDKLFDLINQDDEMRVLILSIFESDQYELICLINNNPELENKIMQHSRFLFTSYNRSYNLEVKKDTIMLCIRSNFSDKSLQKEIFNEVIKNDNAREKICKSFNNSELRNSKLLSLICKKKEFKEQFMNLLCQTEPARFILFETIKSDDELKNEILDRFNKNEEIKNSLFDCVSHNEILKRIALTMIKNDNVIKSKILQIIKQNKSNKEAKKAKEMTRSAHIFFQNIMFHQNIRKKTNIEKLQVYSVTIKHNARSSLSKEDFEDKITSVVSLFGAIIAKQHPYSERWTMNGTVKGTITILVYSSYFTLPLVTMIKEALQESDNSSSSLNIPNNIIDNVLLNDSSVSNILKTWFKNNKLNIKQNSLQLLGKEEDVKKALDKLKTNPPEIPFKAYPLQGHVNIFQINNHVKHINRNKETKWYLNRATRTLLIPTGEDETTVSKFLSQFNINIYNKNSDDDDNDDNDSEFEDENKIDRILWDIDFCDKEAALSRYLINIYLQNGKLIQRHFCVNCVYETFLFNLRKMYNEDEDRGIYESMFNDDQQIQQISFVECKQINTKGLVQMYPIIPFGQLLWSFINESKISNQTRTLITALALRILKKTPKITFCPLHPYILFPSPSQGTSMKCVTPNCCFSLCCWCNKWHKTGVCEKQPTIPPGVRECPFCHEIIEKMEKCNHIHCRCGKDFCYYCGKGFTNDQDTYKHMTSEKHWQEAPDYEKFIKNKVVDQEVLDRFYEKYPHLKPKINESKEKENDN